MAVEAVSGVDGVVSGGGAASPGSARRLSACAKAGGSQVFVATVAVSGEGGGGSGGGAASLGSARRPPACARKPGAPLALVKVAAAVSGDGRGWVGGSWPGVAAASAIPGFGGGGDDGGGGCGAGVLDGASRPPSSGGQANAATVAGALVGEVHRDQEGKNKYVPTASGVASTHPAPQRRKRRRWRHRRRTHPTAPSGVGGRRQNRPGQRARKRRKAREAAASCGRSQADAAAVAWALVGEVHSEQEGKNKYVPTASGTASPHPAPQRRMRRQR